MHGRDDTFERTACAETAGDSAADPGQPLVIDLPDERATLELGAALAPLMESVLAASRGLVVFLEGDLGAGKTTLVRGLLRALGYPGKVKSPTYTLVELYSVSRLNLYHFDFYRFDRPEEYLDAGLDEYFHECADGTAVCLVEWPDKAGGYLPQPDLRLQLAVVGASGEARTARLYAATAEGRKCLMNWDSCMAGAAGAKRSSSPPRR